MGDTQDKYWIVGHADGVGERPKAAELAPVLQEDGEAWKTILQQPEAPCSLQELADLLTQLDQLRDPG
ncbi:hypothetical protein JCM13664_11350 [Methylothermus subterraneus]